MKELRMVNGINPALDRAIKEFADNMIECTKDGYLPIANPVVSNIGGFVFITCFVVKEEV